MVNNPACIITGMHMLPCILEAHIGIKTNLLSAIHNPQNTLINIWQTHALPVCRHPSVGRLASVGTSILFVILASS